MLKFLKWLRKWITPRWRFLIPMRRTTLPACEIRLLHDTDIEACEEIYRLNELAHFPDGYFSVFSEWLRNRRALILVLVSDGQVCGVGGVNADLVNNLDYATMSFGMVHPSHQGKGFGTILLLARLALLPKPRSFYRVILSTVGGSETFYGRFGFEFLATTTDTKGRLSDNYMVIFGNVAQARCIAALRTVQIAASLANTSIPRFNSTVSDQTIGP